jgi:hypothetical protein
VSDNKEQNRIVLGLGIVHPLPRWLLNQEPLSIFSIAGWA